MSDPEELERRRAWFAGYIEQLEHHSVHLPPREGVRYACPCCGFKTLAERSGYEICAVCFWEDDGQDEEDADTVRGGPNSALSLTRARANFRAFGACERRHLPHVRPPLADEMA